MIKLIKVYKQFVPVCFIDTNLVLCYKFGTIFKLNYNELTMEKMLKLPFDIKNNLLSRSRLLSRLFRLGIRYGVKIDSDRFLIVKNKILLEIDFIKKSVSNGYRLTRGNRPLNIVKIDVENFERALYFGDYFNNPDKKYVSIYKRTKEDTWDVVYDFKDDEINHIHNLIPDHDNKCVWILTGDFDDSAAIWKVTNNFKNIDCIVRGKQIYRVCTAFPLKGRGLLYATDSPFIDNSIRLLYQCNGKYISEHIADINGSCIYGCMIGDKYIFSTAVEPDGKNTNILKLLFGQKRGEGIKDNYTHLYYGKLEEGFKDIYQVEKDCFPFIFQFASLKLPCGENTSNRLLIEHTATKKYDCSMVSIDLD
jgi:hypothetical protein